VSIPRFAAYAAAFEEAFRSDDWSGVEPFFHEDVVYEVPLPPPLGGRFEGRAAVLAYLKDVLDRFDRHFATRELELLDGPSQDGALVWVRGRARYTAEGVPEVAFELEELATFDGDRIRQLEDRYTPAEGERVQAWLKQHGPALGIEPL